MQPPPGGWPPPPPGGYPPPHGYPPPQQGYPPPPQGYGYGQSPGYGPMMHAPHVAMFQCPMCRGTGAPLERDKISTTGWIIFAALLICCFPLCIIGLLQKERYRVCAHCNHNLGKIG